MVSPKVSIRIDDRELARLIRASSGKAPVRIVSDGVEYGIYPEMGTERMGAQPFMRPAVEAVRPGFARAFKGAITINLVTNVVDKAARDVERGAKIRAPVDTGALRSSIHVIDGREWTG